jgi:hypothetical protein
LSIAQQRLGLDTAGDLARVPAKRITALRGIGSVPRYELVRLSREWRQRFSLAEDGTARADVQWTDGEKPASVRDKRDLDFERTVVSPGSKSSPDTPEDEVTAHLDRLRNRWQKSVKELASVRKDLVEILAAHGRVLGSRQLAAGLLAKRGAKTDDPAERLRLAAICVRAAVEIEERRESARMASRRITPSGGQAAAPGAAGSAGALEAPVIVALTDVGEEGSAPAAEDLFIYAEMLGWPKPRRSLRRLPNQRTRVPQPNRRRPPHLAATASPTRSSSPLVNRPCSKAVY